ncbi:MAG: hypothetical protein UR25_C0005G0065 [Candidatus Nomurabacteria bacterium GW2011_GWE1_32_28]|uniref:Uncharacterized protein n=1 Tax=Candidatus Nomurabacteria bacterium GW2011_GWF1_31_48 TaxID=1618767 RepID=A0A0F9YEP2_9BACT|nr:MAG: hypothetical protein UR10_C0006G0026 [Candidatus Nomurabacteria bacterium GW2011_GWF2_30_133]KKP28243.1 MAG: hypothetical protein UR18_C0007G0011 [Candidatus Nomurabacteria bacterium GW2011_GWE2_31_40]KKP29838.1 MAG: hypothetical protein UR19_C0007G0012 [Candidatus Nomurabacteria bacterium GW2011_GWF1_31_48]KKP34579.1 MAG: hypothetical protein UR25_C0005G0065 [Candidatus Nomurabacteria bacterium GW2011_GWE1_32_28]HAS80437.1 hypothetical protein [Candidatus Nomurabacteria bacterium]
MKINFREHIFSLILTPLIIIICVISYFRFMVYRDYIVEYEGVCDPLVDKCFIGCEDDACTTEYYYTLIQKYAHDLYKECGNDVTDCEEANICLPDDRECSIVYCDVEVDGALCSIPTNGLDNLQNDINVDVGEEDLLQDNDIDI